jgi:hypothetical protein
MDDPYDVGVLCFAREAFAAEKLFQRQIVFPWHASCNGWRVRFISFQSGSATPASRSSFNPASKSLNFLLRFGATKTAS